MRAKIKSFIKNYYFIILVMIAFLLPDFQVRLLTAADNGMYYFKNLFLVGTGFSFFWAILFFVLCFTLFSEKSGRIVYVVLNSIFIILSFCQYVYFKIFGRFFWLKSIALAGEGADYLDFALKYIDWPLIAITLCSVIIMVIAARKWKRPQNMHRAWGIAALVPILCLSALHVYMLPETFGEGMDDWDAWARPRVVYKTFNNPDKALATNGLYQMALRDFHKTCFVRNEYKKQDFEKVEQYFNAQDKPAENEYTAMFKGKNVIAVMLEGIDTWMISKKYTPTMKYMMDNGINFTNYYSPFFGTGHTFNAEFAFNTGYFSPMSAISATNFSGNRFPYSMANLFKNEGYTTNSFHYNTPGFYNRGSMHKNLGFEAYNSFPDFGMPITVSQSDSNILKNDEIYAKMIEKQPFFDFVITYSGHVPYTFEDAKLALARENHPELIDPSMDYEKNNCLILAADTDDFFRMLLNRLEEDGLLDNTVIVAFCDHYAYGFSDTEKLKSYKNGDIMYRVPAFIYAKGLKHQKISKPAQTIDMLPTIINLFGLKSDAGYLGGDLLSPQNHGFVYFENSAWLDDKMYYEPAESRTDPSLYEHIKAQNKRVKDSFEITEIVISGDYFGRHTK